MSDIPNTPPGDPIGAATDWILRLNAGEDVGSDPEFAAWHAASEDNRSAWRRAKAAWGSFDEEPDLLLEGMRHVALQTRRQRRLPPAALWGLGSIAAAAAAIFVALPIMHAAQSPLPADRPTSSIAYQTTSGEVRAVVLPDGSRTTLDRDSAMTVSIYQTHREVALSRGQAYFAVFHDPSRPFTVSASGSRVTALGTEFDILTKPRGLQILLMKGRVAVADGSNTVKSVPGQSYDTTPGAQTIERPNAGALLAWRDGFVEFTGEPLSRAVQQMDRYASTPIIVKDPSIANLPVMGRFKAGDTERFAKALAEIYALSIRTNAHGAIELRATK